MPEPLPDFDSFWDYDKPDETERKFRELLPTAEKSGKCGYLVELLTQIARTQGLQRKFDEAHQTLDSVEKQLSPDLKRARVRYLLERGRALNSSKDPEKAKPLFVEAWGVARESGEENLAVDAAHMVAIVEEPEESLKWNLKALDLAEQANDEKARRWRGSLYNNIGWTYHDQADFDKALDIFRRALEFRDSQGQPNPIRIAKWCVARCLRSLGRIDEALAIQRELLTECKKTGQPDGFVNEELGECLLLLKRPDEARTHFAAAHEVLSKDTWLTESQPARIERLKTLGESAA